MLVSDDSLRQTLAGCSSVAIVGAKDKPGSPVDRVGRYLIEAGFTVYPVHPVRANVWGLPTFKSLGDIEKPVDIVNLFRASEFCAEHARETLALPHPAKIFWMQIGVFSFSRSRCPRSTRRRSSAFSNSCRLPQNGAVINR